MEYSDESKYSANKSKKFIEFQMVKKINNTIVLGNSLHPSRGGIQQIFSSHMVKKFLFLWRLFNSVKTSWTY
jgi:hypothetical protein